MTSAARVSQDGHLGEKWTGSQAAASPANPFPAAANGYQSYATEACATKPHPHRPYPTQPYPTQPYPTQPYPTQPYPTQPYQPKTDSAPGGMALSSSIIDVCLLAPDILQGLMENHPEVLNEKGFNGQTLLHRAVLSAPLEIAQVLLEHGAHPQTANNHGETALHFAARRGHPRLLHLMLQAGASLETVDHSGKGLVHHAAHGGCVTGIHYLSVVHGLDLRAVDKKGNTPLHISCLHGHVEAFNYLLKNERSDLKQVNAAGDTPLHIAARLGHSIFCWRLLELGSSPILHQPNNEGYTPVDLVRQNPQPRFKAPRQMLEYYYHQPISSHSTLLDGPGWVWWLLLSLPFLMYGAAVSAVYCEPSQGGLLMALSMLVILLICGQQGHRMKHVNRWPNPMFMGMFGAGFSHTLICFYIKLLPDVFDESPGIACMTCAYAALMTYMYYRLLTVNPGIVTTSEQKPTGELYTVRDIAVGTCPMEAFCQTCEIMPPPRTKHCKLCECCIVDMDHHCLFLYRCVARRNHVLFVRFMIVVMTAQALFEFFCFREVLLTYPNSHGLWGLDFGLIFHNEPWVWSLMLTNFVSIPWGCTLLYYQLKVVSKGHTTYFQKGRTQLSRRQLAINALYFLLGQKPYALDPWTQQFMSKGHDA